MAGRPDGWPDGRPERPECPGSVPEHPGSVLRKHPGSVRTIWGAPGSVRGESGKRPGASGERPGARPGSVLSTSALPRLLLPSGEGIRGPKPRFWGDIHPLSLIHI